MLAQGLSGAFGLEKNESNIRNCSSSACFVVKTRIVTQLNSFPKPAPEIKKPAPEINPETRGFWAPEGRF